MGTIRKITAASKKGGGVVIHIQDVHRNFEAQQNIGKAVQELINANAVDVVALEGAFAPIDLSWYRAYPHADVIKAVADWLLKENKISGPVYTGFVSKAPIPKFVGIDDKNHYDANVEAYRAAASRAPAYKRNSE